MGVFEQTVLIGIKAKNEDANKKIDETTAKLRNMQSEVQKRGGGVQLGQSPILSQLSEIDKRLNRIGETRQKLFSKANVSGWSKGESAAYTGLDRKLGELNRTYDTLFDKLTTSQKEHVILQRDLKSSAAGINDFNQKNKDVGRIIAQDVIGDKSNRGLTGYQENLKKSGKVMKDVNRQGGILNTTFGKFTVIMSGIAATLFVLQELRQLVTALIRPIIDSEKAMASLRKETKSTEDDIKRFGDAAKEVQKSGLIKAPEAIEFLKELSSQGYSTSEALNALNFKMNDLSDISSGQVTSALAEVGGAFRNLWQDITDLVNGPMASFFKGLADVINWRGRPSDEQDLKILGNQMRGYQLALSRDGLSSEKRLEIENKLNAIYAERAKIIGKQVEAENIPDTFIARTVEGRNADVRQWLELQKKAESADKKLKRQAYQQTKSMLTREQSLYVKEAESRIKLIYKEYQKKQEIAKKSGRQLFGIEDEYRKKVESIYLDLAGKLNEIGNKKISNRKKDLSDELKALGKGEGFDTKSYDYLISTYHQQIQDEKKKLLAAFDEKIESNALNLGKKEPQADARKTTEAMIEAYDKMYSDLGSISSGYYDNEIQKLEYQRDRFILLTDDQYTAYKWFVEQKFELDKQMLESSDKFTDGIKSGLIEIIESSKQYGQQAHDFTISTFAAMEDSIARFVETGKFSFSDLAKSILSDLARIAAHNVFGQIAGLVFGAMGGTGSAPFATSLSGLAVIDTAHSGGTFGKTLFPKKLVDASMFASAPRLHTGLMPDEYPAILQRGETVIPKDRSNSGGGDIYNVTINALDTQTFSEYVNRNPAPIIEVINRNVRGRGILRGTIKGAM